MSEDYKASDKSGVFEDRQNLHIDNEDIVKIENDNDVQNDFIKNTQEILEKNHEPIILCQSKIKNPNFFAIIYANKAFQEIFGISSKDSLGKSYDFLFEEFNLDYSSEDQIEYFRLIKDVKEFHHCSIIISIPDRNNHNDKRKFKIDFEPEGFVDNLGRRHAKFVFNQIVDVAEGSSLVETMSSKANKEVVAQETKQRNESLLKNVERALHNERLLRQISSYIISDLPISEICSKVAKSLCQHLHLDRCVIHDYRDARTNFVTEYHQEGIKPMFKPVKDPDELCSLTEYINFQNNFCKKFSDNDFKSYISFIEDVKNDKNFEPVREICKEFAISSQIAVTTFFNGHINGGIYLHQSQSRTWLADEIEVIEIIADQLSIALDRSVSVEKVMVSNHALMEKTIELRQALKKEQEMRKMQNEFVALVSHEFKTPLQIIDGTRELLHRKTRNLKGIDESMEKCFERIKGGIQRMNDLIHSTLNLAKMESGDGKIKVDKSDFDLKKFVSEIIDKNMNLAHSKNIEFLVNIDDLPEVFNGDPKLLEHSFSNVISNAIKYSPNESKVKIIAKSNDQKVAFKVTDSGIGIPEDDLISIGKKFFRAKNTLSVAGTGIGLYLSKHFIELHNGKLKIESQVNVGTSVTIILPITNDDSQMLEVSQ